MREHILIKTDGRAQMMKALDTAAESDWKITGSVQPIVSDRFVTYLATLYRDTETEGEEG